mgnify:CR=1 FL=1
MRSPITIWNVFDYNGKLLDLFTKIKIHISKNLRKICEILTLLHVFKSQLFFSILNSNCSDALDLKNLQEQVQKNILFQKLFSVTRTNFSHSRLEQFWKQNTIYLYLFNLWPLKLLLGSRLFKSLHLPAKNYLFHLAYLVINLKAFVWPFSCSSLF